MLMLTVKPLFSTNMKSLGSSSQADVEELVKKYTRKKLDGMARSLGLDPSKFSNKREEAKAILDALPSGNSSSELKLDRKCPV